MDINQKWTRSTAKTFWKDIAVPGEHVLQLYDNPEIFIDMLAGFVGSGINAGDTIIIIATDEHVKELEQKLKNHVMHLESLVSGNRLIVLNAEQCLKEFMVNGMPDENKFNSFVTEALKRARGNNPDQRIRAFGEMVAILWENGQKEATIRLEELWNKFLAKENICLFCAYPRKSFERSEADSIPHICHTHTKIIRDSDKPLTEVYYQEIGTGNRKAS